MRHRAWRPWVRWTALVGAVTVVAAGCASGPSPPSSIVTASSTSTADTVANGAPALGSGQATLRGTVQGPQGPVSGATVQIERSADGGPTQASITAGPGGTWAVRGIPGGSYGLRAWLPPDLATTAPTTFFLAAQADRVVTLQLSSVSVPIVQAAVAPNPPITGQPAQVVVQINSRRVRSDGSLTTEAAVGLSVQLNTLGAWSIAQPNPAVTDPSGQATWTATCGARGNQPLEVDLGAQFATSSPSSLTAQGVPLNLVDCAASPFATTTTTTFPAVTPSTTPRSTTTTRTVPPGGTTTTLPVVGG